MDNKLDEAFMRATLVDACGNSSILSNVNTNNLDSETLISLVNRQNAFSFRQLPILLSKVVTKGILGIVVKRYPQLGTYITPENIQIRIEDDEKVYLITHSSEKKMNIVAIVCKNILVNGLGSSINMLKESLMRNADLTEKPSHSASQPSNNRERITVDVAMPQLNAGKPPDRISDFGSKRSLSLDHSGGSMKSVKRLRRSSATSSTSSALSSRLSARQSRDREVQQPPSDLAAEWLRELPTCSSPPLTPEPFQPIQPSQEYEHDKAADDETAACDIYDDGSKSNGSYSDDGAELKGNDNNDDDEVVKSTPSSPSIETERSIAAVVSADECLIAKLNDGNVDFLELVSPELGINKSTIAEDAQPSPEPAMDTEDYGSESEDVEFDF